jgi:hypothetical protein
MTRGKDIPKSLQLPVFPPVLILWPYESDQENRIYYEPRCVEGNYALPGWLRANCMEELAFAQGRGPDPATRATSDVSEALTQAEVPQDPLQ